MVKENSYIHIEAFMVNELGLKGNELLIYAIIFGFSQDGMSQFSGSLQYLADWTNSSKQGVLNCLKSLCEKQLLLKSACYENNVKYCSYKAVGYSKKFNGGSQESLTGYSKKFNRGIKKSLPNTINNTIKETITYTDNACVSPCDLPDNNLPEYKAEPKNFQSFCKDCFETITQHNSENKNKMAVSRDFFAFSSKEGRELARLIQSETMENLLHALKNYLLVSKLDTWKTGFSFNAFCKNYTEYLPEFFSAIKYLKNIPKGGEVELVNEARKKFIQNGQRFRVQTFIYHRQDWINMGMPENIEELCQRWLEEDEQNGIDYKTEIEEWKKLMGEEEK